MDFAARKPLYEQIEQERGTKIISYVTGDRPNAETQIGADCIDIFVDVLDAIGPTQRISLLLHTNGGNTAAARDNRSCARLTSNRAMAPRYGFTIAGTVTT